MNGHAPRNTLSNRIVKCAVVCSTCAFAFASASGIAYARDKSYRPPLLPDGHPDLQGMWEMTNLMPMERPRNAKSLSITSVEAVKLTEDSARRQEDPAVIDSASWYRRPRTVEPINGELRSSIVIEPADGRIPFTAQYQDRRRLPRPHGMATGFEGPEARSTMERCIASEGAPIFRAIPSNNLHQFVQTADVLVMHSEELPETRIVRIGGRHGLPNLPTYFGDSIGWWEGDTLVVETKYFLPATYVSPKTTVVERFTRVSNDELVYRFTIDDPDYYTQSWTGENHFVLGHERLLEYACHEGNYSLTNILRAARAMDAADKK